MSASILFDSPGPRTIARHRIYTVVTVLVLLGFIGFVLYRLNETGQLAYDLWEPFLTPDYIRVILVDGLLNTLKMALGAIVLAIVFGLVFGIGKLSEHRFVRLPCWAVVEFFRAVPVLLLMVLCFYMFSIGGGIDRLWCVIIALAVYNGSVLAEVFRAGVNAVPKGQVEAAYAIGMRKSQVMMTIQLPQAVKIMLPALLSQCVVALKDTSLGYYIAAPGLTAVGKLIYTEFGNQVQTAIVITSIYVAVNLVLTGIGTWVQKKYVGEQKPLAGLTDMDTGRAV